MSTHKVVIVGESGVGKSTILHQYVHQEFKHTFSSTIGIDFAYKHEFVYEKENSIKVQLRIFDTGGQKRFETITDHYHKVASDAVIIVYDVTNIYSFDWACQLIQKTKEIIAKMERVPIILVANKIDLKRVISQEQGQKMADLEDCIYIETSAKDHDSVNSIFKVVSNELYQLAIEDTQSSSDEIIIISTPKRISFFDKIMKWCFCTTKMQDF